jgi:hypothetical protein
MELQILVYQANQFQVTINCGLADQIWIGWSHYGTRYVINNNNVASAKSNNVKSRNNQEVKLNYL